MWAEPPSHMGTSRTSSARGSCATSVHPRPTDALIKLAFERPPSALLLLTFKNQFNSFAKGVIDLRNVVYFASVTTVAVMAATYSLKSRNWN